MGRHKLPEEQVRQPVTVYLNSEERRQLSILSHQLGCTKSQVVSWLLKNVDRDTLLTSSVTKFGDSEEQKQAEHKRREAVQAITDARTAAATQLKLSKTVAKAKQAEYASDPQRIRDDYCYWRSLYEAAPHQGAQAQAQIELNRLAGYLAQCSELDVVRTLDECEEYYHQHRHHYLQRFNLRKIPPYIPLNPKI